MACFVGIPIEIPWQSTVGLGWDDSGLPSCGQRLDDAIPGVEGLIGDQHASLHRRQEVIGANQIMHLPAGQKEADRVSKRIDQGVDLGAQSAARPPDGLVFAGFFWAPALCW